jgi:imidazolonepropionase-like amidohydrolase
MKSCDFSFLLVAGSSEFRIARMIILFCFLGCTGLAQQNPVPAPKQLKSVLILNARAHLGNGEVIENSAIGFKNGTISLVADARLIRLSEGAYDTIIHADGQHVYPGFIAANSTLGLHEIDAVRAQNDLSEIGTFKPGMRTAIAYNADSEITPTVRSNGVLIAQVAPRGGIVSGTSSVVQLDAWNWEDALIREDDGIHLNWPEVIHLHADKGKMAVERVKTYDQQRKEIALFFSEAKTYAAAPKGALTELRFEATRGLFDGSQTLYVHADQAQAILEAIQFKKELDIPRMVLVGGYDALLASEQLISEKIPVMVRRLHLLPEYEEDEVDASYTLATSLYQAGILFCFQNQGGMERMGLRNLPFYAGTAVAYGLPYEEAVRGLTLNPAKILGIDERYGSIETGKSATLFISGGDALDMRTNSLTAAFIDGRMIDLSSKQTELYQKYRAKYAGK